MTSDQAIEQLDWVILESSNLNAAAYNGEDGCIYLMFKSGPIYRYEGSNALDTYLDLLDAPSAGKFLHQHIIPNYKSERIHNVDTG